MIIKELLTIEEIVSGKFFKIPDYQRGYSWEKEQVEDLIKDIEHIRGNNHKHYTGTLVITKKEGDERYDIVDGQQRLTTLIILIRAIYASDKEKFKNLESQFLIRDEKHVLETNLDTKSFFRNAIIGDDEITPEIKSLQNLKVAKELLTNWVKKNELEIDSIRDVVIEKLGFICFSPANTDDIGIMFEVINNRGKALSELEKIKNYFIYFATIHGSRSLREKVNDTWGPILRYLNKAKIVSNDDENRYLRNCYIVFYSSDKSKSWNVYDQLKSKYPVKDSAIDEKVEEIKNFISFIRDCAKFYAFFANGSYFNQEYDGPQKNELSNVLKRLRCHPVNASIFPLYLSVMTQLHMRPDEVLMLLKLLEILNFRVYVLPNTKISRADSKQGDLFYWAHEFYEEIDWHTDNEENDYLTSYGSKKVDGDIFEWLRMELTEFIKYHCPETTFIQSLTTDQDEAIDYYRWPGLRFFLASYEEKLSSIKKETWDIEKILISRSETEKEKGNDYLSREHIWASKNRVEDFPEDRIDKRRLGNFVLIGLSSNIQLSKDDIEDKVDFLIERSLKSMIQVNDLEKFLRDAVDFAKSRRKKKTKYFYLEIAQHLIDARETELINFALERWRLPNERMNKFDKVDSFEAWSEGKNQNYYLKD